MKKRPSHLLASIVVFLLQPGEAPASPPLGHSLYRLPLVFEEEPLHAKGAAKRLVDLNSGEPRTVRLIYFRPTALAGMGTMGFVLFFFHQLTWLLTVIVAGSEISCF